VTQLLEGKRAIVYGAGGNVGGAVARAFAREGAPVHLTGPTLSKLEAVAADITAGGGQAEVAQVDALDRDQVEAHAATVAPGGGIDISFNAIWIRGDLQGTPLLEMPVEDFLTPIDVAAQTHFLTATAAARHMVGRGSGAILMLSASASRLSGRDERFHTTGGFGVACGAIETFSQVLAGEVGPRGVRVLCLRSDALPERGRRRPRRTGRRSRSRSCRTVGSWSTAPCLAGCRRSPSWPTRRPSSRPTGRARSPERS
jgi:NAD(P)-dependent dehydrogenase (short-subunit alcohol dehydrogenase family)